MQGGEREHRFDIKHKGRERPWGITTVQFRAAKEGWRQRGSKREYRTCRIRICTSHFRFMRAHYQSKQCVPKRNVSDNASLGRSDPRILHPLTDVSLPWTFLSYLLFWVCQVATKGHKIPGDTKSQTDHRGTHCSVIQQSCYYRGSLYSPSHITIFTVIPRRPNIKNSSVDDSARHCHNFSNFI